MEQSKRLKVVIIGDTKTGKTTWIKRLIYGDFSNDTPTLGVEVHKLILNTNYGKITFNCWDTAGDPRFGGLRDGYYIGADAAIIFSDITKADTIEHSVQWKEKFEKIHKGVPIILVCNKVDLPNRIKKVKYDRDSYDAMYIISSKSNYNYEKPLLDVARLCLDLPNLCFIPF